MAPGNERPARVVNGRIADMKDAELREYRRAAKLLLRGRGFTFVVLLALGLGAASVAAISRVSGAVLRPVAHALGFARTSERCSRVDSAAAKRRPTDPQKVGFSQPREREYGRNGPPRRGA